MYSFIAEANGLNHVGLKNFQNLICIVFSMDVQVNRLGKIKAEDFVISFTKDFTLSMEFNEILTVFILFYLLN